MENEKLEKLFEASTHLFLRVKVIEDVLMKSGIISKEEYLKKLELAVLEMAEVLANKKQVSDDVLEQIKSAIN